MKKRFVAFLLVLIMVLGMLPVSAMAAGSVVTARGSAENPIRIYENSGNQAETSYGSVQVPVGETVTDSGQLTFSTYSAIEGVQVSTGGFTYCNVTSSNENVVKATGSWSGGVLTINFQGVGNGTAKITVDYTCTCSKGAAANGYLIYNVTVGDGGTTDPSGKPNAPTASDIGAFPDAGKAVLLHCVDAGARGHDATASSLNKVQNGYSVGEVVENPGTYYNVDGGKITKEQFPWMCVVTVHAAPFIELYNSNFSESKGVHKLAGTSNATATLHWFWHNTYGWQYLENPPIQFNITKDTSEKTYTLTYYKNTTDTVTNMPDPNPQTETSNTGKVTFPISNARPVREGYNFLGWAGKQDATEPSVKPGNTVTTTATTTKLYAVWQSNTPPTDKPAKPTENDVTGVVVDIVCVTKTGTHDTVQYQLGFATTPQHTIGEVASDGAGGYICPVTVRTAWFVQQASNLVWKVQHTPTAQTITFNLTYDKNSKTWVKPAANPRIEATHEVTPPTKPIITGRQEYIRVICKNEPNKERNYVPKFGRYTESDPAVQKVNGVWTYTITILRDKHVEEFNKDFPGHEDTDPNAVTTMSWVWKDAEWKLVPVNGLRTVGAIIEVICEPKAPTADELKKLEMAVQVKCVVDASQQHKDAYGLLGECDVDYFVGEPKKVGDDWLCDISYDPDPYVAEFNKAFPTPKHIQNDEKIVPVTLIWVGGSWQIKTQGRVLVTEVYTVTFDSYGGTPVPPAQEVEYGLTATKPDPAPTKTGYTFDGWYLGDEKYDFSAAVEQNIALTAKWTLNTYTVTFDPNGGNELAEADKTKAVKIGEAYGELPTPTRKGYNFAGWYTEAEEGTVVTADTTVSAMTDHTLYAHWEAKKANVHIMIFKSNDLGTPIVDRAYTTDAVYGDTLDLAEIDPSSYLDFDFEIDGGWYDDGLFNLYKKYVSGEQANKPAALTKLQITGNWQNLKLIVTELVPVVYFKSAEALAEYQNDHSKVENIIFTTKARVGSTLPTADAPTATRDGYTFTFWSREGQIGTDVTGQTVNGWTNLVANWEARTDTPYTVEHYLENLDGNYALDTTEHLKGTTDTTVTAAAKSYDNFTYDSTVPGTVASGNIAGDGSLVLKLFYTRNTYDYTVRHIKQLPDGTYDEANAEVETLSGKFEALAAVTAKDYGEHYPTNDADTKQNIKIEKGLTIDVKYDLDEHTLTFETNGGSAINPVTVRHGNAVARPADPTKDKYTFIGWYADPEFTEEYDFATVLEADKTIYAKFELTSTPIGDIYVRYDVLHIKQLPDGTYDLANAEVEHLSAKKDTTVTAVIKDYRATHHVNVNRTLSKLTGTAIQPYMGVDGKPVYTILSVYYDLDFHTLTFDTMGGSKIAPETVRHGLTVAKPKDPVNGGYIFDGWYTDKTYRTPYNFATPLTQDTTIYAKWFLIVLPGVTVKKAAPKLNTSDHFAYVQGYPDGTVKPAGNITRAETAAILFRLMDDASRKTYYSTKSGFRDVASGSWYNTYVATLNNAGVITDSSNGYFRPNEAITRAELAAMLAKFSETTGAANYFNDVSAKYWAANAIAICAKLGWITGYPDGTFRPDKNVTRAELMAMINRATGRAPKSADAFLPGMKTWIDNTSDKWYYLDVQEATNSHSYTVKGSETWTALTSDPNWSLYE